MQAAVIAGERTLRIADAALPQPGRGEVRVRLEGCGVCASNLPVWQGRPWFQYPLTPGAPGHEGWGVVDAAGDDVAHLRPGDRVAILSNRAYAEYDIAAADSVVPIPSALAGRSVPAEAVGCAMNIFRRSDIQPNQTVAIIGAGFLGNALVQLGNAAGARVIAVSRRESARELAAACGAAETIPMDDHMRIVTRIKDLTGGAGAERVIECVGTQWPLDIAGDVIAEGGRIVIAGYHQDGPRQVNMQQWNWLGIDVINAHERNPKNYVRGMREGMDAIVAGTLNLDFLLTHTYALDQLGQALDHVADRPDGFVKGVILL
jgi:2-desacetyl-2-hydroxyethyl bacteriochlorophyllide A dehydrogenase